MKLQTPRNMTLKALALALAVLLWVHVATDKSYEVEATLPVTDVSLGVGLALAEAPPDSITALITASGKDLLLICLPPSLLPQLNHTPQPRSVVRNESASPRELVTTSPPDVPPRRHESPCRLRHSQHPYHPRHPRHRETRPAQNWHKSGTRHTHNHQHPTTLPFT